MMPSDFPEDLKADLELFREERRWMKAVNTPGSLVRHKEYGWIGRIIRKAKDPVNGRNYEERACLVEHEMPGMNGFITQRWYPALDLSVVKVI